MIDSIDKRAALSAQKPSVRNILLLVMSLLLMAGSVEAKRIVRKTTSGVVGFKVGIISRAKVGGDLDLQTDESWAGEVFADVPLSRSFFAGLAFDFYKVRLVHDQQVMLSVNATLKHLIRLERAKMDLKPGIAFGYAHLAQINVIEPSDYSTIRLFFETAFDYGRSRAWLIDWGVFWTLGGGNDEYDISIGPAYMFRVGVQFK